MEPQVIGGDRFEDGAREVLSRLRNALGRAVAAIPGARKAAELRRILGLDAALAWQVFTIGTAEDVIAVGRLVPKARAMDRFVRAARKAGVDAEIMSEVERAYEDFDVWVCDNAETRESFTAILTSLRPPETVPWTKLRRSAFRANCGVWGVSVRASVHCAVFHQRPTGEIDNLSLRAQVGVRGYRAGVGVSMSAMLRTWGGSEPPPETPSPKVMHDGARLLTEYCSKPVPRFERRSLLDGSTRDFLVLDSLGRTGEATVWWSSFNGNFPDGSTKPPHGCSCRCSDPTELLLVDLLLPQGWSDPETLGVRILGPDSKFVPERKPTDLPFEGHAAHLGTRLQSMYTPQVPEYAGIVERELALRGWENTIFDVYRCVVRYPILHSFTLMYLGVEGAEGGSGHHAAE